MDYCGFAKGEQEVENSMACSPAEVLPTAVGWLGKLDTPRALDKPISLLTPPHTYTRICLSIIVRTLIDIIHSPALTLIITNYNHYQLNVSPNQCNLK